jgi:hypothetical protein
MRIAFCFLPPFLPQLFQVVGGEPIFLPTGPKRPYSLIFSKSKIRKKIPAKEFDIDSKNRVDEMVYKK